jgi:DNA primase
VQKTENVSFIEAIEVLAREAGMPMPAQDPRAAEMASRASRLAEVMEMAVQHYRLQLSTRAAEEARAYLARRGLSEEAQKRWEIGFASEDRHGLSKALLTKGTTAELLLEAGLTGEGQGGTYDRFWGRIIFPIRDARGRAIALGGRSLDPNARAKYLNSPQTPLFDKGRNLFNHGPAREACGKGGQLVVAEGYMDVIALAEAGFKGAVAPLGTAITEEQLQLLWRIHDEPVMALDGRRGGAASGDAGDRPRAAAARGREGAALRLPARGAGPGRPHQGQGCAAMQAVLDEAQPMVRLLGSGRRPGKVFDSPERKAALDKALREAISAIRDPSIRRHYGEEIKELRYSSGAPRGASRGVRHGDPRARRCPRRPPAKGQCALGRLRSLPRTPLRQAILAMLVISPGLIPAFADEIEAMDCPDAAQAALRGALLRHAGASDLRAALAGELGEEGLDRWLTSAHILAVRRPGEDEVRGSTSPRPWPSCPPGAAMPRRWRRPWRTSTTPTNGSPAASARPRPRLT